jgi:starch phosphorylase
MQLQRRGASQAETDAAEEVLDPDALTIGFARRFATYKRATLLLRDPERLARILNDPKRPVQMVFAGKAHPRDDAGKGLIQQVVKLAQQKEFRRRLVFLEDYDMAVARYLVQGADVWLNTPLRPLEASGTSGMKALANGGLNLSILDGWWDEAWRDANRSGAFVGWAIGRGEDYQDRDYQDQIESAALYDVLEHDVIPTFYERGADGLPRRWIAHMKSSVGRLCPTFNMHRVVKEYTTNFYVPAHERLQGLIADGAARAKAVAAWLSRIQQSWHEVRVESVDALANSEIQAGAHIDVRAGLRLGPFAPEDIAVELYLGRLDAHFDLDAAAALPMQPAGPNPDGSYTFEALGVPCPNSGLHGYTVRVLPFHADEPKALLPGLILWADGVAERVSA